MRKQSIPYRMYSALLRLYPRPYHKKYATQIQQTLVDLLDNNSAGKVGSATIWIHAWLDTSKSIVVEHMRRVRPRRFVVVAFVLSLVLLTPLLVGLVLSLLNARKVMTDYNVITDKLHFFGNFVIDRNAFWLWGIIFPAIACLLAGLALVSWTIHRTQHPKAKLGRGRKPLIAGLAVVCLVTMGFLSLIANNWMQSERKLQAEIASSAEFQAKYPTLACKLLPVADARRIMGDRAYMINDFPDNSGTAVEDPSDSKTTTCMYQGGVSGIGVLVYAREAKNSGSVTQLKQAFDAVASQWRSITIYGYSGFYLASGNGSFSVDLWMLDHWISVTAKDFETANQIVPIVAANLRIEQNRVINDQPVEMPLSLGELTESDRRDIEQAVLGQESDLIAGTGYNITETNLSGDAVNGTYSYANGKTGTYSATKKRSGWTIVEYQRN